MKTFRLIVVALVLIVLSLGAAVFVQAQRNQTDQNATTKAHDPGVRTGTIDAGGIIGGTTGDQKRYFVGGQGQFTEIEGVTLMSPGNGGLGPTFNGESCGQCHSQPATGGTSPSATIFPMVGPNPQVADANDMNASNAIPFFVTADGPVHEARFKSDSGVHDLFTIAGRMDAVGCTPALLSQPNFQKQYDDGNLSLRIPTPVFGAGLIEAIAMKTRSSRT